MKIFYLSLLSLFFSVQVFAQCTPGNAASCPDPENNGEICPKILAIGHVGQAYSQEITLLPPPTAVVAGNTINLYKIRVTSIGNLPPGLNAVSNSANNDFMTGTYYCFLISGTPTQSGYYPLKINVDAYVNFMGNITMVGSQVDSTSLFIGIDWTPNGMETSLNYSFSFINASPNPFSDYCNLDFLSPDDDIITASIYNTSGQLVITEKQQASAGQNTWQFNGKDLESGVYFCTLRSSKGTIKRLILKQ